MTETDNAFRFENKLYAQQAQSYHAFVSRCDLTNVFVAVNKSLTITDPEIIELGAGTGVFTTQYAPFCAHITAIESFPKQIAILRKEIERKRITNASVVCADANKPACLKKYSADYVLMGFSLDNICGMSVYDKPRTGKVTQLFDLYKKALKPNGRFIIVGSMPEDSLHKEKREPYHHFREAQFEAMRNRNCFTIEFVDYYARFQDHTEALRISSNILGTKRATHVLQGQKEIHLKAYVASFAP